MAGLTAVDTITTPSSLFASELPAAIKQNVIVLEGEDLPRGQVVGKITDGAITVEGGALVGTGNGVLTLANPAYAAGVKAGVYKVVFVEPATDLGAFIVEDPDGIIVGRGNVGTAFTGIVKFTIADGSTDFLASSYFPVTVTKAAGSGKIVEYDPDATDGSQNIYGILAEAVDATDADKDGVAWIQGHFNLNALTADESVVAGEYKYGNLLISSEVK